MSLNSTLNRNLPRRARNQKWGLTSTVQGGPIRSERPVLRLMLRLTLSLGLWAAGSHAQVAPANSIDDPVLDPITAPQSAVQEQPTALKQGSDAYGTLARQIELGEFAPAVVALEQQVKSIERTQHRYHADLIQPLTLLGDAKYGAEDYPGALDAYGRAIHLTRVSSGLHSADQVPGVYREAKVYKSAGDLKQANDREEYAWRVLQKTHGRYSPELLPGIRHLADWYGQTYNVLAARSLYMRAVRIVEANYDDQHPEMVTALRGLAQTYRLERFPPTYFNNTRSERSTVTTSGTVSEDNAAILLNRFPQGEKALKRVVRIQQAKLALLEPEVVSAVAVDNAVPLATTNTTTKAPELTGSDVVVAATDSAALALTRAQQKLIAALVELGDWYLLFERSRVAMQYFTQAEAINGKLRPGAAKVDFSRPALLHFPTPGDPRPPKPRYRGERKQGFVDLNYTITVRGSIANLETVGSSPKGLMDYRVRKSMLAARYRPSFVDGAPRSTQGHNYRHQFDYYPTKPDPAAEQPANQTTVTTRK